MKSVRYVGIVFDRGVAALSGTRLSWKSANRYLSAVSALSLSTSRSNPTHDSMASTIQACTVVAIKKAHVHGVFGLEKSETIPFRNILILLTCTSSWSSVLPLEVLVLRDSDILLERRVVCQSHLCEEKTWRRNRKTSVGRFWVIPGEQITGSDDKEKVVNVWLRVV